MAKKTKKFRTEVNELLNLVISALYSNRVNYFPMHQMQLIKRVLNPYPTNLLQKMTPTGESRSLQIKKPVRLKLSITA